MTGDAEEFCLVEYGRLVGSLTLFTGDADLAIDLAQEALARTVRHWGRVREMPMPGAWAYRVAINLAKGTFVKRRREQLARNRLATFASAPQADIDMALSIRAAVLALPERQRAAVVLRYYADLPVTEVAEIMHIAEGTVKALTHQAVTKLRTTVELETRSEVSHGD